MTQSGPSLSLPRANIVSGWYLAGRGCSKYFLTVYYQYLSDTQVSFGNRLVTLVRFVIVANLGADKTRPRGFCTLCGLSNGVEAPSNCCCSVFHLISWRQKYIATEDETRHFGRAKPPALAYSLSSTALERRINSTIFLHTTLCFTMQRSRNIAAIELNSASLLRLRRRIICVRDSLTLRRAQQRQVEGKLYLRHTCRRNLAPRNRLLLFVGCIGVS